MKQYCDKCGMLLDETSYYLTNNLAKYPTGRMTTCKKCVTMHIDNLNPKTFLPILEDIDVPYIKEEWEHTMSCAIKNAISNGRAVTGMTMLSKYLAKMRLRGWRNYRWKNSPHLQEKEANYGK